MTIEKLNTALSAVKAEVEVAETELSRIKAENKRLQEAVSANYAEQGAARNVLSNAREKMWDLEYTLNDAVAEQVARGFDGLSREELKRRLPAGGAEQGGVCREHTSRVGVYGDIPQGTAQTGPGGSGGGT